MVELLEEDEALKTRYVEERDACGEITPIKEYGRVCAKPWAEKATRRGSVDTALVNELMNEVGSGCRKALEGGNQYIPLDNRKVAACSADVGK